MAWIFSNNGVTNLACYADLQISDWSCEQDCVLLRQSHL